VAERMTSFGVVVGRQQEAVCGCALVEAAENIIGPNGEVVEGHATIVVPCSRESEEAHVALMREAVEAVGHLADWDAIMVEFERRLGREVGED
jgi:hypothetical protein